MPLYEFKKKDSEEVKEIYFSVKDCPKIGTIIKDEDGIEWERIFSIPFASVDTKIDHNNPHDFVEKTGKKKGSYGDLLDASQELSRKRAKESDNGTDPVQTKFFKDYSKKRHGVKHLEERRQSKIERTGYSISYD